MTLESFLASAKHAATDAEAFLVKVWHAVEGTQAVKNLEVVAVESFKAPIEAAVATILPVPFSSAVDAWVEAGAKLIEAEISASAKPASQPPPANPSTT